MFRRTTRTACIPLRIHWFFRFFLKIIFYFFFTLKNALLVHSTHITDPIQLLQTCEQSKRRRKGNTRVKNKLHKTVIASNYAHGTSTTRLLDCIKRNYIAEPCVFHTKCMEQQWNVTEFQ